MEAAFLIFFVAVLLMDVKEPGFFAIALIGAPIAFIIGAVGLLISAIRRLLARS